jgi:D-arabinose 1-dehydrogenase-like Zn-dependent alcohol dehydrogenase
VSWRHSNRLTDNLVDVRDSSLALASHLGADAVVDTTNASSVKDILEITSGGVHASIVLAESQSALAISADITRKHGTVCLVAAVSSNS